MIMKKITADEAKSNVLKWTEENKELIERPAKECLEAIYSLIEDESKNGKDHIKWSDSKYTLLLMFERYNENPTRLSRLIMQDLRSNGYRVEVEGNAGLKISW